MRLHSLSYNTQPLHFVPLLPLIQMVICSPQHLLNLHMPISLRSSAKQDLLLSVQVQGTFTRKFSIATSTYFVPLQVDMSLPILLLLRSLHHPSMPSPCTVNEECFHLLHSKYSQRVGLCLLFYYDVFIDFAYSG